MSIQREFTGTIAVTCMDLLSVIVRIENTQDRTKVLCHYLRFTSQGKQIRHFCHCLRCLIGLESTRANTSDGEDRLYEAMKRNSIVMLTMEDQERHGCDRCTQHLQRRRELHSWR